MESTSSPTSPGRILIVDDMEKHAATLARTLMQHGFETGIALDSASMWRMLDKERWGLVLLDIRLGDEDGIEVLRSVVNKRSGLPVVMITAFGAVNSAVEALKIGAVDYLEKPLRMDTLLKTLRTCLAGRRDDGQEGCRKGTLLGAAPAIIEVLDRSRKIAASKLPVVIYGESGTGKELLAEAIHDFSPRREKPMIRINCAALPETLLDNELFGHEKGAFTGADSAHPGLFERAEGSTLFLDEIGDMPLSTQGRILRAIQSGEIWRLGGTRPITVDVRFICATNASLEKLMTAGKFREDLYYRLGACTFTLPPLRERREDIELLCRHFVAKFSPSGETLEIHRLVLDACLAYAWPGNVRELQNAMQYAASMATGGAIDIGALPEKLMRRAIEEDFDLREDEKRQIVEALRLNSYNRGKTADSLRMNRTTLYRKMRKHGII